MPSTVTSDTGPFAIIPEWVIDHPDLSATAVRLYGVLARYSDGANKCFPSRRALWTRVHCSEHTLDKAVDELQKAGAIHVRGRVTEKGDQTSHEWTVLRCPPGGVGQNLPQGGARNDTTGGAETDARTRATIEREPMNESTPAPVARVTRADRDRVFDALCAVFGPAEPKARGSLYAKVAGEIIGMAGADVSDFEVTARAQAIRKRFGEKAGVRAVSMHWHDTPLDSTPGWMRGIETAAQEVSNGRGNGTRKQDSRETQVALPDVAPL